MNCIKRDAQGFEFEGDAKRQGVWFRLITPSPGPAQKLTDFLDSLK